jgi:hypothetical protein
MVVGPTALAPSVPSPAGRVGEAAGSLGRGRPLRVVDADARARLAALVPRLAPATMAAERVVPVHEALATVLPQGLMQGSTVGCTGEAATSAALLVVAEATQRGAWVGVAGLSALGVQAAGEAGVDVERLVAVRRHPDQSQGRSKERLLDDGTWGQILAAMVDGFDLVLLGPEVQVRPGTARRVQARAQPRGAVLVLAGEVPGFTCDLQVRADAVWDGLGDGHGHLRARRMQVEVHGRRVPRPRRDELWFPALDGRIASTSAGSRAGTGAGAAPSEESHESHAPLAPVALERAV